jgi:regulatory protein
MYLSKPQKNFSGSKSSPVRAAANLAKLKWGQTGFLSTPGAKVKETISRGFLSVIISAFIASAKHAVNDIIITMPVITGIKQQKNKNRVNVYLDDQFGFGIDLDNFVLLHLKVDQELSAQEVEDIVKKSEFQKDLNKVLRFASVRPRSEKEIRDYFKRKDFNDSNHQSLLDKLKHFELLDDTKFAKWWVEQRQNFKPKPKRILVQELRIKGIGKEIIDEVLGEEVVDEEKIARELLEKKMYKWKNFEPRLARQKMSQYLVGEGFSWEIISKVTNITEK